MTTTALRPPTEDELTAFMGRFITDAGAAVSAVTVLIGDHLGLYRELVGIQPATAAELAQATGTEERNVREWLLSQAASGYVEYDATDDRFALTPAQAACLASPGSATDVTGAYQLLAGMHQDVAKVEAAFRSGAGLGWHEHSPDLFAGTERFFRPGYVAALVDSWLPALDGVVERLTAGASVADVGCGHGASTILMAQAFPASRFVGFDYHVESIERARAAAAEAGVSDRVRFDVAPGQAFPGDGYDLITMFDCLHDMGDPVGAARHVRQSLAPGGTWMLVEPAASDRLEDNFNPVGRLFYSASTMICVPASRSQDVGLCLGAQAGPARLAEVTRAGGFSQFRVATTTPVNLVLEVRP